MNLTVRIWRQPGPDEPGRMTPYPIQDVSPEMSLLELLDELNERLTLAGQEPVAFDSDCREGICGMCSLVINGVAHGPQPLVTSCQVYLRAFADGAVIDIEPWRAGPFPIVKDLVVDRGALDRIIEAGGYISVPTGSAPEAHSVLVPKDDAEDAFDAATCIGCGACVAACPNASAALFLGAKITHLGLLPQGQPERDTRALSMIARHDAEGFGGCTQIGECTAVCPKGIGLHVISRYHRDVLAALARTGRRR